MPNGLIKNGLGLRLRSLYKQQLEWRPLKMWPSMDAETKSIRNEVNSYKTRKDYFWPNQKGIRQGEERKNLQQKGKKWGIKFLTLGVFSAAVKAITINLRKLS
jgi:hypothetical protein